MRHKMISIIGASLHEIDENAVSFARELGKKLATSHFGVICDGSSNVSEEVCRSLHAEDHSAPIVALVNGSDIACHNQFCSVVIPTGQEWGSDRLVANGGDVVVVIGGGVTTVGILDFLCNYSDKQVLVVPQFSDMLEKYVTENIGNEHITTVKTVDEIMWYLEVMTEDFSFLPKSTPTQASVKSVDPISTGQTVIS